MTPTERVIEAADTQGWKSVAAHHALLTLRDAVAALTSRPAEPRAEDVDEVLRLALELRRRTGFRQDLILNDDLAHWMDCAEYVLTLAVKARAERGTAAAIVRAALALSAAKKYRFEYYVKWNLNHPHERSIWNADAEEPVTVAEEALARAVMTYEIRTPSTPAPTPTKSEE